MSHGIFISLTQQDTRIAEALRDTLKELFGDFLHIHFSTSKELAGGISSGEDWFQWIVDRVQQADFALILVTPSSVHKPWILWEAGAVAGAALASKKEGLRKVRPLVYQVATELIPSPIRDSKVQFRRGDNAADFKKLLQEILHDYKTELDSDRVAEFGEKISDAIKSYLAKVQVCLLNAPAVASPVVIEEWRLRLDEIMTQNRPSEVGHLHDWMDIAFGRARGDRPQPLDLRIHSRLASLYLRAKNYPRAIEQLELARQLAPRDIFVLRQLGRAYLDSGDSENAKDVIDRIAELDKEAFVHNAECAALAGRWYRSANNLQKADEIFSAALDSNPSSYYLANVLAEVRLDAGKPDAAAEAFKRSLKIIDGLGESSIWTHATAANAAFFTGDDARASKHLLAVNKLGLDAGSRDTIEGGLTNVARHVEGGEARLQSLLQTLRS